MNFVPKGVVYQKKCVYLQPKIDERKVEQCGKHLYGPNCEFARFILRTLILMPFCFSCMYWHSDSAYR